MRIKQTTLFVFAFATTMAAFGQKPTCASLQTGSFKVYSKESGTTLIERTRKIQTEKNEFMGYEMVFDITWIDECTYLLKPKKLIKGDPVILGNGKNVLKTRIKEISENTYVAEASSNFSDMVFDITVEILK
jgi:hypothetical protein